MNKIILLGFSIFLLTYTTFSQESFPVNGVKDKRTHIYALKNATIYVDYQTIIKNATLIVKDDKIEAVGSNITIPKGAIEIDLSDKIIYPAIVEPYSDNFGISPPQKNEPTSRRNQSPQYESSLKGSYGWNDAIKSTYNAIDNFSPDEKKAEKLRKTGFGALNTFNADGIVRGSSLLLNLSDLPVNEVIIKGKSASHYSFDKGSSTQQYPVSIMGAVALLRQTYYDANWYKTSGYKEQTNLSLQAFNELQSLPQIFEANGGKFNISLIDNIGDEFKIKYIVKGNGDEYQRIKDIKNTGVSLIIPVNFPEANDVSDPIANLDLSLKNLKHWELAPSNAKMLNDANIEFAFTSHGLKDVDSYWSQLRKTVDAGLYKTQVIKSLTYTPAKYFKLENKIGGLKNGMIANFFVTDNDIFEKDAKILQTWVQGVKYEHSELNQLDLAGKYDLTLDNNEVFNVEISGKPNSYNIKMTVKDDTNNIESSISVKKEMVYLTFEPKKDNGKIRLSGWVKDKVLSGNGTDANGQWIGWTTKRNGDVENKDKKDEDKKDEDKDSKNDKLGSVIYPFNAFGSESLPKQEDLLIQDATVWALEDDNNPILINTDVLVINGKINKIGKNLPVKEGTKIVVATGKHLTPGIIDEHSHIALFNVNEGSHAVTSEVSMYDAVNPDDINIYRQLAGGVTTSQLLHGSANPIGGQSAIIKLKWGESTEGLKIQGSDPFIKFALGENVKQSNWGSTFNTRFPQTRMGVEQVYVDAFTRAKEYGNEKAKYDALPTKTKSQSIPPRKDLQLDALLEILQKKRFITCHSYVQSEIVMLMNVADKHNFKVNTFTHILEGYKVADKMAKHGVGGSTFSDWWAYKYEVKEAIPYNAALMAQAGVVTAINSDDAEMGRRLNQEAAKSIKYGDMEEVEALKMVTINPAKLLHLDHRLGTIKEGKDADLVLWNNHPLSIYAKPEMTMIEGAVYFSIEKDEKIRKQISEEKSRLIAKMEQDKSNGGEKDKPKKEEKHDLHCSDEIHYNNFNQE